MEVMLVEPQTDGWVFTGDKSSDLYRGKVGFVLM